MATIKREVVATTGYDAASVELTQSAVQVVVTVANSKLTDASNRAREAEATRIVATITKASTGSAEFQTIQTSHVDCVSRESDGSHPPTVDAIDFRRTPERNFEHRII